MGSLSPPFWGQLGADHPALIPDVYEPASVDRLRFINFVGRLLQDVPRRSFIGGALIKFVGHLRLRMVVDVAHRKDGLARIVLFALAPTLRDDRL